MKVAQAAENPPHIFYNQPFKMSWSNDKPTVNIETKQPKLVLQ